MSLFEPDQPDPPARPGSPAGDRRPRRAVWLAAPAVTLAIGVALGFALGSQRSVGEPASTTATQPAPAPVTSVVVRPTASSACLETATRADQIVDLLIRNRRREAADLLVAYTIASRQCRRDASP